MKRINVTRDIESRKRIAERRVQQQTKIVNQPQNEERETQAQETPDPQVKDKKTRSRKAEGDA